MFFETASLLNCLPHSAARRKRLGIGINAKRINWPKPGKPRLAENLSAPLEFGCGRGKECVFGFGLAGEVRLVCALILDRRFTFVNCKRREHAGGRGGGDP